MIDNRKISHSRMSGNLDFFVGKKHPRKEILTRSKLTDIIKPIDIYGNWPYIVKKEISP
jgi:hypothetical protein